MPQGRVLNASSRQNLDIFGKRVYLLTDRAEYAVCWIGSRGSNLRVDYIVDGQIIDELVPRSEVRRCVKLN